MILLQVLGLAKELKECKIMNNREKIDMNAEFTIAKSTMVLPILIRPLHFMKVANQSALGITREQKDKNVKSLATRITGGDKGVVAFSPKQVEQMLGISHPTLYELIRRNELKSFKVGRRRCITSEALAEYIINRELEGNNYVF